MTGSIPAASSSSRAAQNGVDDALTVHPAWEALRINPGVANGFQLPEGFAVLVDDYRVSDVIDRASGDSLGAQTSPTT